MKPTYLLAALLVIMFSAPASYGAPSNSTAQSNTVTPAPVEPLTAQIAKSTGLDEAQSKRAIEALSKAIRTELEAGRSVEIPELGAFSISKRNSKVQPGMPQSAPKYSVRFAAAPELRAAVAK